MSEPVIKCESVYKIFGENAKKMLQESNGNVDAKTYQKSLYVVADPTIKLLNLVLCKLKVYQR